MIRAPRSQESEGAIHRKRVSRASFQKSRALCTPPDGLETNANPLKVILFPVLTVMSYLTRVPAMAGCAFEPGHLHKNIQLGLRNI